MTGMIAVVCSLCSLPLSLSLPLLLPPLPLPLPPRPPLLLLLLLRNALALLRHVLCEWENDGAIMRG